MKIAIIGSPGSGKSTLSFKLQKILKLPLYHLDQFFWQPGWQRPDRAKFAETHNQLCDQNEWIIEGMATRLAQYRLQRATIIIFLDIPLDRCLYRIFKRAITDFGKTRKSSAKGCPDRLPSLEFLTYIWNFNKNQKPEIYKLLQKHKNQKQIHIVKNNAELKALIRSYQPLH